MPKRKLREEFQYPLDQVQRGWIRKPVTVLLTFFVFLMELFYLPLLIWRAFTVPCWKGPDDA